MVKENERMLTGGFYAEVTLGYDASIAQEKGGRPFGVDSLRAIQLSKREVLDVLAKGREQFTTQEWRDLLLRSVGFRPEKLSDRKRVEAGTGVSGRAEHGGRRIYKKKRKKEKH